MLSLKHATSLRYATLFLKIISLDDWIVSCDVCYKKHMLMGLATYGMNDCHDACYMRHEPLPFHMIWHNTWPIFHDTMGIDTCMHICTSSVCIHAYVCHMTHGIKRWQISKFTYSKKPTYHFISTRSLN
jgi:hypothetical protein